MSTSEIAKLESRWRENPQGLTFAPLAEAYRKAREPQRALDVLRVGLERHPQYIPASIVLGRCHLDLGDDEAAESAFQRVLNLDDENVIALKGLSDIAERQSRFDESEAWLRTLLTIDRSNDEARAQLARVAAARLAPPPSPAEQAGSGPAADAPATNDAGEGVPAGVDFAATESDASWAAAAERLDHRRSASATETPEEAAGDPVAPMALDSTALRDFDLPVPLDTEPEPKQDAATLERDRDGVDRDPAPFVAHEGFDHVEFAPPEEAVEPMLAIEHEEMTFDPGLGTVEQHDEIELRPTGTSEYQLGGGGEDWGSTLRPGADASEFQVSHAGEEVSVDADASSTGNGTEEFGRGEAVAGEPREALTAYSRDSWTAREPDELDAAAALSADDAALAAAFAASASAMEPLSDAGPAAPAGRDVLEGDRAVEFPELPAEVAANRAPISKGPGRAHVAYERSLDETDDEDDVAAARGTPIETDLVVTESMAELYLRQGHRIEALRVYRELYRRSPEDLGLRETVDALEVEEAEAEAEAMAATGGRGGVGYVASDRTRSVGSLFNSLLSSRPPEVAPPGWQAGSQPSAPPPAGASEPASEPAESAPTRPASDHLSLSSVFGDDGSPVPPAVPSAPSEGRPDGLSFDDFFEEEGSGQVSATKARSSAPRDDEDLDQFHAWLQNLKR